MSTSSINSTPNPTEDERRTRLNTQVPVDSQSRVPVPVCTLAAPLTVNAAAHYLRRHTVLLLPSSWDTQMPVRRMPRRIPSRNMDSGEAVGNSPRPQRLHSLVPDAVIVDCTGCGIRLGAIPGSHKCQHSIAEDAVAPARFTCTVEGCRNSYPSKQGLANHTRNRQRKIAVAAAAVPLPLPATRQRSRLNPGPAHSPWW